MDANALEVTLIIHRPEGEEHRWCLEMRNEHGLLATRKVCPANWSDQDARIAAESHIRRIGYRIVKGWLDGMVSDDRVWGAVNSYYFGTIAPREDHVRDMMDRPADRTIF